MSAMADVNLSHFFKETIMLRKLVCAAAIVVVGVGVVMAEEFRATIIKIDDGKVTFKKGKQGQEGEAMTLPTTTNIKVSKGTFNTATNKVEAGEPLTSGLKNEIFNKIGAKGLRATITTDADNKHITAITVGGAKKPQ
jgi:hypothetical protein